LKVTALKNSKQKPLKGLANPLPGIGLHFGGFSFAVTVFIFHSTTPAFSVEVGEDISSLIKI
jgi:hypothetical protein